MARRGRVEVPSDVVTGEPIADVPLIQVSQKLSQLSFSPTEVCSVVREHHCRPTPAGDEPLELEPFMEWVTRMDMDMEWISGGYGYFLVKSLEWSG